MATYQKSPDLKFKYVNGLGDLVAAILHCKMFGWLTKILTGKDQPCQTCSMRRSALNVLVHIPLWKLFFKNKTDLVETLAAEYRGLGYDVEIDYENTKIALRKVDITLFETQDALNHAN
jgi:hypothetical protein